MENDELAPGAGAEGFAADAVNGAESVEQLAEAAGGIVTGVIHRFGIALIIVIAQIFLIRLVWFFAKKISAKVKAYSGNRIKGLTIKNYKILTSRQIIDVIIFFIKIAKYLVTGFQLFITVPIIFSLYPATKDLATTIFGYVLTPLKNIAMGTVHYIPNVITIIIILTVVKYALHGLKFLSRQLEKGKMIIPGFYADWARPTFNLLRFLVYAFTVALIYPYLPGSDSRVFQGVSVFVGIIFSLGSSNAIGNLVAGLVITYMRPFKIGDRIKIKDITGYVVEKSHFVIRLRNIKNEFITFPNLTVLNSDIINFNTSGEEEGLILHANINVGYDVPWRDVYDALVKAAVNTPFIEETPKPFVLQKSMEDFYAVYEINAYTKEIEKVMRIYSLLYQNIQDEFKKAGIDMLSPHYFVNKVKPGSIIQKKDGQIGQS